MHLGGPGEAAETADFSIRFGPLPRAMAGVSPERRAAVMAAVAARYRELETPAGIVLEGSFWVVSARC